MSPARQKSAPSSSSIASHIDSSSSVTAEVINTEQDEEMKMSLENDHD